MRERESKLGGKQRDGKLCQGVTALAEDLKPATFSLLLLSLSISCVIRQNTFRGVSSEFLPGEEVISTSLVETEEWRKKQWVQVSYSRLHLSQRFTGRCN